MYSENLLEKYRKKATVSVRDLQFVTDPEPALLHLKFKIWSILSKDPLFQQFTDTPSVSKQKEIAAKRIKKLYEYLPQFLPPNIMNATYKIKTRSVMTFNEALAIYSRCLSVKFALGVSLFSNALPSLGTEMHFPYSKAAWNGDIMNGFAITEIAHGSNTKQLQTTATFDAKTNEFIIHTPNFQAAKCWVGNLGSTCTHCIVFAQLMTPDGSKQGLHGFITPIRDPKTMKVYPGIIVGDMGEKPGLNGVDNGFVLFNHYRIPRDNLLNKTGDINGDGEYASNFTNPQQILGAVLENLSAGRLGISQESVNTLICAITIAIRYAVVRKQFGPTQGEELSLIEYPLHQTRLLPFLAAACVFKIFIFDFSDEYLSVVEESYSTDVSKTPKFSDLSQVVQEIHAMVSCCKPYLTWICRDGIQECREACGGNGYLKAARFGELRNDHDPSVTYEGDNNVLIQQTSNWLIRQFASHATSSPLHTIDFMSKKNQISETTYQPTRNVANRRFIQDAYEWLLCWLLNETNTRLTSLRKRGLDVFNARSHSQVYRAKPLALIFAEYSALTYFWNRLANQKMEKSVSGVFNQLGVLYGLWCLEKHLSYFYQGGYSSTPDLARSIRDSISETCSALVPEVVTIVDAIAPPDFALNSILGYADGKFYQRLENMLIPTETYAWWRKPHSKL